MQSVGATKKSPVSIQFQEECHQQKRTSQSAAKGRETTAQVVAGEILSGHGERSLY